jgi:hypothetical protein
LIPQEDLILMVAVDPEQRHLQLGELLLSLPQGQRNPARQVIRTPGCNRPRPVRSSRKDAEELVWLLIGAFPAGVVTPWRPE